MKRKDLINEVSRLLSYLRANIENDNAIGLNDINKIAEDVIIPIFTEIYDTEFYNLNKSNYDNFPGVDITNGSIVFQITSSSSIVKIKDTLSTYLKYNLHQEFDEIRIFILTKKQRSYSLPAIKKITNKIIEFDLKQIVDITDLLKEINSLPNFKIEIIKNYLSEQFELGKLDSSQTIGKFVHNEISSLIEKEENRKKSAKEIEKEVWSMVKKANLKVGYEQFLKRFPNSRKRLFAELFIIYHGFSEFRLPVFSIRSLLFVLFGIGFTTYFLFWISLKNSELTLRQDDKKDEIYTPNKITGESNSPNSQSITLEKLLKTQDSLLNDFNFLEATKILNYALENFSEDNNFIKKQLKYLKINELLHKMDSLFLNKEFSKSIKKSVEILDIDSTITIAQNNKKLAEYYINSNQSDFYLKNGDYSLAMEHLQKGIRLNPKDTILSLKKYYLSKFKNLSKITNASSFLNYFLIEQGNKLGLAPFDSTKKVIEPMFHEIKKESDYFLTRKNDKYGLINYDFELILKPEFDEIKELYLPLVEVKQFGKKGIFHIYEKGYQVKPFYEEIEEIFMPFFLVNINNKLGVINIESGKIIVPANYDEFYVVLADNLIFVVGKDGKYSAKNLKGKTIYRFKEKRIENIISESDYGDFIHSVLDEDFNDKFNKLRDEPSKYESIWVNDSISIIKSKENKKYGIEISDEIVRITKYDTIYSLKKQNLFCLVQNGGFSCIDFNGITLLENQPLEIVSYSNNYFKVKDQQGYSLVNQKGEKVTSIIYDEINNFSENFAKCKKGGKYGFIQVIHTNKIKEPENFDFIAATNYNDGLASVARVKNKNFKNIWIVIDYNGDQTIDYEFTYYDPPKFINGVTAYKKGNYWGMMNKFGDIIIKPKYQSIFQPSSKDIWVKRFNVEYIIDTQENFIEWRK